MDDTEQLSMFEEPVPVETVTEEIPLPTNTQCSGCSAPIVWRRTKNGKPIPLNPALKSVSPNGHGKRLYLIGDDGVSVQGFECNPGEKAAKSGRVTHFATCPKAEKFRKE